MGGGQISTTPTLAGLGHVVGRATRASRASKGGKSFMHGRSKFALACVIDWEIRNCPERPEAFVWQVDLVGAPNVLRVAFVGRPRPLVSDTFHFKQVNTIDGGDAFLWSRLYIGDTQWPRLNVWGCNWDASESS